MNGDERPGPAAKNAAEIAARRMSNIDQQTQLQVYVTRMRHKCEDLLSDLNDTDYWSIGSADGWVRALNDFGEALGQELSAQYPDASGVL